MERKEGILHMWSSGPLKQKDQVLINKELGIRIAGKISGKATVIIASRSGTQVSFPNDESKKFNLKPKDSCFSDFVVPLLEKEKVQVGEYLIGAFRTQEGTSIFVESNRHLDIQKGRAWRKTLRRDLSDLFEADSRSPQ